MSLKIPGTDQIGMSWVLLLERLGSFALVAYVVLYGFPRLEERLTRLETTQTELVSVMREYVNSMRDFSAGVKRVP
jgi:hypothetical protein